MARALQTGGKASKGYLESKEGYFKTFDDMATCHNYVTLLNYFSRVSKKQQPVQDSFHELKGLPAEFLKVRAGARSEALRILRLVAAGCLLDL